MKIKVCGLRDPRNIERVAGLNPDYMGYIFYGPSPRFVTDVPAKTLNALSSSITKTAVFVNETAENINALIDQFKFDAIQLHGNENAEFCAEFKGKVLVLKAFGVNGDFNFEQLNAYTDKVDFFLFDTKTDIHGGSGKTFDWDILNNYQLNVPFFLSGGIGLDNLEEIKKINHPQFYGVDLNSRFETAPGMKNIEKLKEAFTALKQFDTNEIRS